MTKQLVILGSTGSIGRQTLDVCRLLQIRVLALTAGSNVDRMEEQCREFSPLLAVMADEAAAATLRERISDLPTEVASGEEGLLRAAALDGRGRRQGAAEGRAV